MEERNFLFKIGDDNSRRTVPRCVKFVILGNCILIREVRFFFSIHLILLVALWPWC
jgi:hypothetical protein